MAAHVQVYPLNPDQGEGAYRATAISGLVTLVAAGTATAGHLMTLRWAPSAPGKLLTAVIQRIRARWTTIAGFTAAQEVGWDLYKLTAYTAAHTGGSAITAVAKNVNMPAAVMTGRIADTAELTAGTQTIGAPIASSRFAELAAAATVPKGAHEFTIDTNDNAFHPIVLLENEGLLLRNSILMGAAGTARLVIDVDWLEVVRY